MEHKNLLLLKSVVKDKLNPILIQEQKSSFTLDFVFDYVKSICCGQQALFCDKCEVCHKINQKNYFDIKFIDAYANLVSKEEVVEIINNFAFSSLEKYGYKFLIIYGIEQVNKFIANSLLKNIETPFKNTFYIFTTRNPYAIINTIRSRCFLIRVAKETQRFKQTLIAHKIEAKYLDFFVNNFFGINQVLEFYQSANFEKFWNLFKVLTSNSTNAYEFLVQQKSFKTFSYQEIFYFLDLISESVSETKKTNLFNLQNNLKYNINKTLIFNQILDLFNYE
ncbi:MAG: DNA polymerase III subunit delta' [Malacoplasma sp.]|nr:DNA polymerase III subunit delta' [Malacoplasma sp.]